MRPDREGYRYEMHWQANYPRGQRELNLSGKTLRASVEDTPQWYPTREMGAGVFIYQLPSVFRWGDPERHSLRGTDSWPHRQTKQVLVTKGSSQAKKAGDGSYHTSQKALESPGWETMGRALTGPFGGIEISAVTSKKFNRSSLLCLI